MNRLMTNLYESEMLQNASVFILANLLWILLSIPVITLPAATAGLFATLGPWAQGKPVSLFPDFFVAMRRYWAKSTLVAAIDLAIGGLITMNLLILRSVNMPQIPKLLSLGTTLAVALSIILANIYVWPLMVMFEMPLRRLLKNSVLLMFGHPWWSILVLGVILAILGASVFLPRFLLLSMTFSSCALVMSWGAWRVARRYVDAEELAQLENPKE